MPHHRPLPPRSADIGAATSPPPLVHRHGYTEIGEILREAGLYPARGLDWLLDRAETGRRP